VSSPSVVRASGDAGRWGCADQNRHGVGGENPPRREAGLANYLAVESCAAMGNRVGEALDECAGWVGGHLTHRTSGKRSLRGAGLEQATRPEAWTVKDIPRSKGSGSGQREADVGLRHERTPEQEESEL